MGQSCPDSTTSFRPPWAGRTPHLHRFTIDGTLHGSQFDDCPEDELDEAEFTVSFALRGSLRRFVYEYDFGDSWTHEVVVEDVAWTPYVLKHGVCLDGGGACPPEDVGGTGGYEEFLAALADPLHEEHDSCLVWVGYKFDPGVCNVAAANAALQRVR
ncbi:MAG TPA: plasmid pRiA4b ORF-3 family protein [Acidimicrobiales bacterium]